MRKLILPVILSGAVLADNGYAATSFGLEDRLSLLEQRLKQSEKRADKAEKQIEQLRQDHRTVSKERSVISDIQQKQSANAVPLIVNGMNNLKLYGDVELNMDAASRSGQLTSLKTSNDKHWKPGSHERWDINGRILMGLDGYAKNDSGFFSGFSVQPLANING